MKVSGVFFALAAAAPLASAIPFKFSDMFAPLRRNAVAAPVAAPVVQEFPVLKPTNAINGNNQFPEEAFIALPTGANPPRGTGLPAQPLPTGGARPFRA